MKTHEIERLCEIMAKLRSEEGCGWDRKQTLSSLKRYLVEETFETIDAIEDVEAEPSEKNRKAHLEELGDLLFQVVFQAQIQSEKGVFDFSDICNAMSEKLIRRHPHIFGADKEFDAESNPHWERIKAEERKAKGESRKSIFDGIPKSMPALQRAALLNGKAAEVGFDWPDYAGALKQFKSEVVELEEVVHGDDIAKIEHELGDVMLACVDVARHKKLDPEHTLKVATARFEKRFRHVEEAVKQDGKVLTETSSDEYEAYWQQAKRADLR
jgi:MazG family protein